MPSLLCAVVMMSEIGMLSRRRSFASTGERKSTVRVTPPALNVKIDCVAVVLSDVCVIACERPGTFGAPRNR